MSRKIGPHEKMLHGNVSGQAAFVAHAYSIARELDDELSSWIRELRAKGVKGAHPPDGWFDKKNRVTVVNPQFDDGVRVGDFVVLGWGYKDRRSPDRLYVVTAIESSPFSRLRTWVVEDAGTRSPIPPTA